MAPRMRSKQGNPTAAARKQTGSRGGKYPVFDHKSAMSAIRLRHHGKGISASTVLAKVRRWAKAHGDKAVLAAARAAAARDRRSA